MFCQYSTTKVIIRWPRKTQAILIRPSVDAAEVPTQLQQKGEPDSAFAADEDAVPQKIHIPGRSFCNL